MLVTWGPWYKQSRQEIRPVRPEVTPGGYLQFPVLPGGVMVHLASVSDQLGLRWIPPEQKLLRVPGDVAPGVEVTVDVQLRRFESPQPNSD